MNKKIKFTIFNEDFWGKGLIYSQNLLQLIKLKENYPKDYNIEIYAFTSFLDIILYRKKIIGLKKELNDLGIKVKVLPTLFVRSRLLVLHFFVLPLFFLNMIPYILEMNFRDHFLENNNVIYHLRSYPISLIFMLFYKSKGELVFDPRSDYVGENKAVGFWKEQSISDRVWMYFERLILNGAKKTIFVSDPFMDELLKRNHIYYDNKKHFVFYNPIDYKKFEVSSVYKRNYKDVNFLYTGSLGNWNNLETYLDFFLNIKVRMSDSKLFIATSTPKHKYQEILDKDKYRGILNDIEFYYNLTYDELPVLYKKCTVGLQLMSVPDSRLGVKFVEYMASGLLPVVNYNVRGAAKFCRKGYGITIERSFDSNYELIAEKISKGLNESIIDRINESKRFFDVNVTYEKLKEIYG